MPAGTAPATSRERLSGVWDEAKASFGLPAGLAMLAGLALGFGLSAIDEFFGINLPTFAFDPDAARGLLETIATVTVSVAGLAFSVTIVAFTLTSSQLSPRVLRTFRGDRLSQTVLAMFLGTFIYCLVVLIRLGATGPESDVPELSVTLAVVFAFVSFLLFAAFIAHIARQLQPSSVISSLTEDAASGLDQRYPSGVGTEPEDPRRAEAAAKAVIERGEPVEVRAEGEGYLTLVLGDAAIETATEADALVRQRIPVGDYILPGDLLAEVWGAGEIGDEERDELVETVRTTFELGRQRSLVQDLAFSVRQLSDIALKGFSTGINDPTTAENAMDAMAAILVRFARAETPSAVRLDDDGEPRFVARMLDLDDLVSLGFEQVRVFAASYPVVSKRLLELLARIRAAAEPRGLPIGEVERQASLIAETVEGEVPTDEDAEGVKRERARLHHPRML